MIKSVSLSGEFPLSRCKRFGDVSKDRPIVVMIL